MPVAETKTERVAREPCLASFHDVRVTTVQILRYDIGVQQQKGSRRPKRLAHNKDHNVKTHASRLPGHLNH